jgi:hypothetical protein
MGRVMDGRRRMAALAAVAACVAGCTSGGPEAADPSPSPSSPSATTPSPSPTETPLQLGEFATVALAGEPGDGSEVRVAVTEVREGRIRDLREFVLDEEARSSTPYYADVRVRSVGGAGEVSGERVTLWGLDSSGTVRPPADVLGRFRPCQNDPLPRRFRQGDTARTCLLYLLPEGTTLEAVQYRSNDRAPYSWPVS